MTAGPSTPAAAAPATGGRSAVAANGWRLAQAALLVGLVLLAAWRLDWPAIAGAVQDSSWHLLAAAGAANLASSVLKSMTWQGLVDGLPEVRGRSRWHDLVAPLLIGAMLNAFLVARMGDVAKVVLARRRLARRGLDVSPEALAGTMIAEHGVSTAVWGALAVAAGAALPMPGYARLTAALVGGGALAVALLCALVPPRPLGAGRAGRPGVALRCCGRVWCGLHESSRGLGSPGRLAYVVAAGAGQWVAAWAATWMALAAVGIGAAAPSAAAVVVVTLTVAHAVPLLPGNIGTFQIAAALPLAVSFGVPPEQALAFGLALQASEIVSNVGGGLVCAAAEGAPWRAVRRRPLVRPDEA